jgi:hypothetical protein
LPQPALPDIHDSSHVCGSGGSGAVPQWLVGEGLLKSSDPDPSWASLSMLLTPSALATLQTSAQGVLQAVSVQCLVRTATVPHWTHRKLLATIHPTSSPSPTDGRHRHRGFIIGRGHRQMLGH